MADVEVTRLKKAMQIAADIIEIQAREYRHPDCMCEIDVRTGRGALCGWCEERFRTVGVMRAMAAFTDDEEALWALMASPSGPTWRQAQEDLLALLADMDAGSPLVPPNLP